MPENKLLGASERSGYCGFVLVGRRTEHPRIQRVIDAYRTTRAPQQSDPLNRWLARLWAFLTAAPMRGVETLAMESTDADLSSIRAMVYAMAVAAGISVQTVPQQVINRTLGLPRLTIGLARYRARRLAADMHGGQRLCGPDGEIPPALAHALLAAVVGADCLYEQTKHNEENGVIYGY